LPGFGPTHHAISDELCTDLVAHLELGVRGGVPSPEYAAQLLRRLRDACRADPPTQTDATRPHAYIVPKGA
jgi:hypothetical protein